MGSVHPITIAQAGSRGNEFAFTVPSVLSAIMVGVANPVAVVRRRTVRDAAE